MPSHADGGLNGSSVLRDSANLGLIRKLALCALALNCVSALLFIASVKRPVYDEPYLMVDATRYASAGVSLSTLRAHINAMGPTGLILAALPMRVAAPDNRLTAARIAILASWLLLGASVFVVAPRTESPEIWYVALFFALIFPHAMTATATLLTEGPALLFALTGSMLWVYGVSAKKLSIKSAAALFVGGFLLGVSVTCRQYYFAAVGAAALFALYSLFQRRSSNSTSGGWTIVVAASFLAALAPIAVLFRIWGGLSSPLSAAGSNYGVHSHLGVSLLRPVIAALCIAIYLLPFTFPFGLSRNFTRGWRAIAISAIAGISAAIAMPQVLQPGPIHSFVALADRLPWGSRIVFGALSAIAIFNAIQFVRECSRRRHEILQCPPAMFAALVVLLFMAEQFAIGGEVPFFDRYVLQIAAYLGAVVYVLAPRFIFSRYLSFAFLWGLSQFMLWRYLWVAR
ncbi:MAG TPA: hypothetical protein VFO34_03865 [Candidatus Acidoferrales bacterium]|nr:hypothetical protein [Candidatus Acidoferrales bacterium]